MHDKPPWDQRGKFSGAILRPYLRQTRSMKDVIPWPYLKKGLTGEFSGALAALIGVDTPVSALTVTCLKNRWGA